MAILSFSHPKGGVGKTTLCFNFLVYLQKKKIPFLCIDLDGQNSISKLNEVRKHYKLKPFDIYRFESEKSLIDFLQKESEKLIIVDSGGFDSAYNRIILSVSDNIITPLSDSAIEILRLIDFEKTIIKDIEDKSKEKLHIHILLNKINPNIKDISYIKEQLKNTSHFTYLDTIIKDRLIYKNSLAQGRGVLEIKALNNSQTKAQDECKNLSKELYNML